MKKFIKIVSWIVVILIVCLAIFFTFIGPRMIVTIGENTHVYKSIDEFKLTYQPLDIKAKDGKIMKGIYCASNLDTTYATVIFVHGIRSKKEYYFERAEEMANNGLATLVMDLRAHGASEGDYCTFGYNEVGDIQCFIDTLLKLKGAEHKIGLWGQSLGGAISLLTLADDTRLDFGVIESTYANYAEITEDYTVHTIGFRLPKFLSDYNLWRATQIAEFDITHLNPEEACAKIEQPILLIHGTVDDKIKIDYAHRNFKALKTTDKTFLPVEGADHMNVWKIGGATYFDKVYSFIKN
jgi:alpha-beta hydrolase superfamily lysophospholipase